MQANKKTILATGIINAFIAAIFLTVGGVLTGSTYQYIASGIESLWLANIATLMLGLMVNFLVKTLIVLLIAVSFIAFGFFLAICILTFLFSANANAKFIKGVQIVSVALDVIILYNFAKILHGIVKYLITGPYVYISPADKAVCILVLIAAVAVLACAVLNIIYLATAKSKPKTRNETAENGQTEHIHKEENL